MSIRDQVLEQPTLALPVNRFLWRAVVMLAGVAAVTLAVVLATYHLDLFPTTWFDEGSHLHVPKALIQLGVYADTSSEGFRYFGPTTGIGPTIMLPIALMFKMAGIGLLQARLVITMYFLAALGLFFLVTRHQYGLLTAGLAVLLLITSPGVDILYFGRQVLGEVPALAFLLLGVLLWWSSTESETRRVRLVRLLLASLAFGLVALTKNQFSLILAPTFIVLALVDQFYYRSLGFLSSALPFLGVCAGIGVGLVVQFLPALGAQDLIHTAALYRDASAGAIFVFSPARIVSSLKFLASADNFGYLGIPAVLYGLVLSRQRSVRGAQQGLLAIFVTLGLAWFAFGSIGWPRYAFPALALTAIFAAKLLVDVIRALGRPSAVPGSDTSAHRVLPVLVALAATVVIVSPFADEARSIFGSPDRSPQEVAAYLDTNVPTSAVVETWEPELGFLTNHAYHYPPSGWLDRAVRAQWGLPAPVGAVRYDPIADVHPTYLVVGKFGKYTGIYNALLEQLGTPAVASFGAYDVYRLS
jgi:hypothetical protein